MWTEFGTSCLRYKGATSLINLCYFSNTHLFLVSNSCHKTERNYSFFVKWQKSSSPPSCRAVKRWWLLDISFLIVYLQEKTGVSMHNPRALPQRWQLKAAFVGKHTEKSLEQSFSFKRSSPHLTKTLQTSIPQTWSFLGYLQTSIWKYCAPLGAVIPLSCCSTAKGTQRRLRYVFLGSLSSSVAVNWSVNALLIYFSRLQDPPALLLPDTLSAAYILRAARTCFRSSCLKLRNRTQTYLKMLVAQYSWALP